MHKLRKIIAIVLSLTLIFALSACGAESSKPEEVPDLNQFYDDFMASLGDDAPAMIDVYEDESYVETFFPGLNDIELNQSVLRMSMISAIAFELALVECANEEDVETVQTIFQGRIDSQVDGGAWYPETTASWENADLLVNGNVVALIVAGEYQDDAVAMFNELFGGK